ncbi:hypothetical protein KC845_03755 [Candidatus Kaiserbacteria bacterium]|nr:hypothetical protein [Candidatus Kaiserbacteria bacterium]
MFTTIITDCKDDNARGRQQTRIESLTGHPVAFVGVDSDLEAGMQLIDMLDACEGRRGLILVNVAPRGGHTRKWENGTPFAYFTVGETLIVSSVDGFALSGIKKFGLTDKVQLLDTRTATEALKVAGVIDETVAAYIPETQFRSFDFTPRVGAFLFQGGTLKSQDYPLSEVIDLPKAIWHIDSFGNCKTTLTPEDIITDGLTETRFGSLPYVPQLRDLPDSDTALVRGSSGLASTRLLEIMSQRISFAEHHEVSIGDDIFEDKSYFSKATN